MIHGQENQIEFDSNNLIKAEIERPESKKNEQNDPDTQSKSNSPKLQKDANSRQEESMTEQEPQNDRELMQ